ncbi:DUF493 family protein [Campylobacter sp.]|uniref:HP0495 family protein n=1 Tax=Campylobacter sp. TaxID=205 RepID=UPI0026DD771E|nr:DUF493 family protein [Campylobacter sp.]MDO4673644.1 DUF493 family protein [Campylobacter sp.]
MENLENLHNKKQDIHHSTFLEFKVILKKEDNAEKIFEEILKHKKFEYKLSNISTNGKYQSFLLRVIVEDQEEPRKIFDALRKKSQFVL